MKKLFAFLVFTYYLLAAFSALAVTGLDDTPIGPNVPNTGKFTNLEATGTFILGGETATNISGIDGKNTKVSSDDTTPGFLNGKLVPGNGITLTENGGGGSETLSISANDKLTTKGDVLTHDGTSENRLPVGTTGQVLVVDPATANGVTWGNANVNDVDDGVEITFTREFEYDPGTGNVPAIDINGTDLVINQTDPTVTLGGQARSVLATSDIPNTTPQLQQVIIDLPSSLTAGNYKIKLTNTQGKSEAFIPLSEIALHDGSTWTQATASAAFSARSSGGVLSYNSKLWVLGGWDGTNKNDVWSSTDGITWTQVTANAAWSARNSFDAVVYDNKMWVMGGHDGSFKNDVWSSTDGITWTLATANANWSTRSDFEIVVFDNKMWVLTGYSSGGLGDVWSSSDGIIWTQTANGAFPSRYRPNALVLDNKLWIMGGYGSGFLNDVWSSTDGITWTQVVANAAWSARTSASSAVYDNKMWMLGGNPGGTEVWNSTDGSAWSLATSNAGWGSRSAADAVLLNDRIWLVAGEDGSTRKNDVWHTSD